MKELGVGCCVCPACVGCWGVWAASVAGPALRRGGCRGGSPVWGSRQHRGCCSPGQGLGGGGAALGNCSCSPQHTQGWGCRIHAAPIALRAWGRICAAPQGCRLHGHREAPWLCQGDRVRRQPPHPARATHPQLRSGPFPIGTALKSIDTVYFFFKKKPKLHSFSQFLKKYRPCPGLLPQGQPWGLRGMWGSAPSSLRSTSLPAPGCSHGLVPQTQGQMGAVDSPQIYLQQQEGMQDRKAQGALAPAAPSDPTPLAPTSRGGFESWVWGFFYTNKGTKRTKVFGGVGEEQGAPRAHLAMEEEGGGHRLPPHLVVVAHHPLDVEEFVAQGFGLQLLRLIVGALKGSTGPASAAWALGRGLQPGGGQWAWFPPPPATSHQPSPTSAGN